MTSLTNAQKVVWAVGLVSASIAGACAAFALYHHVLFLIHGPRGTQELLIAAIAMLVLAVPPSLIAAGVYVALRKKLSRLARSVLWVPLAAVIVLIAMNFVLNQVAYGW